MATSPAESDLVGATSSMSNEKTPAQILQEKHDAAAAHNVTVEDVVDEEDLAHPPPPSVPANHAESNGDQAAPADGATMSEKLAGKQKAREPTPKSNVLDTKSEELFPALGGGPKPRTSAAAPGAWGAKKSAPAYQAVSNGNLNGTKSSPFSSGRSTPQSGVLTPASTTASTGPRGPGPMKMSIPGKYSEELKLHNTQMDRSKATKPVLDDIKRRSRVNVSMLPGPDGSSVRFIGTGPKDEVHLALKRIARELGLKQKVQVEVPSSLRPYIIGRGGATIQGIMKKTGANIQMPKADVTSPIPEEDDSVMVNVEVEGDAHAAEMARQEIEKIVAERTSNLNLRMRDVPPEFFPFIAGPNNSLVDAMTQDKDLDIRVPPFHTWHHQPPPRISQPKERPEFKPHPDMHIHIAGERAAVQQAQADIKRQVELLRQQLMVEEQTFQRGQHQFILGERGMSPHDFLQETGCIVVLPPDHEDTEDITIIGPPDRLEFGVNRATALAAEMLSSNVDPRKHITNAPRGQDAHARALSQYLKDRRLEEELNQLYNAQVAFPGLTDPSVSWDLFSRDGKNLIQARSDLTKVIQAHPPARLSLVEVDPFFHTHLRSQCTHSLRDDLGVHMVLPPDEDPGFVVLVYEGPSDNQTQYQIPRQRPTNAEISVFEEALRQAENQILSIIGDQQNILSKSVEIPPKFHEKVRKFVSREQQAEPSQGFPVQISFGEPRNLKRRLTPPSNPIAAEALRHGVSLRGPGGSVDDLEAKIMEFLQQAEKDELERGYTTTFDFPAKFNNYLIGKKGSNINELRERFDVDITTLEDGKVEVKGPNAKAEACKSHIIMLGKKWEDEVTYNLKIEPKFHRDLIGRKGEDVNKLQDKYNVKIQFPRSAVPHDDQSMADTASEVGGNRGGRASQAADEVVIRGPRQGADKARSEILELYQYFKDHSFTGTVSVAKKQVPSLMGKGGSEMDRLRSETGAHIDVPGVQDLDDTSARVELKLKGSKKAVEAARVELQKRSAEFDDIITRSIEVDKKYHQNLIGAGGSNIRRIVLEAGGPENSAKAVKFPSRDSESSSIRVEGTETVVSQIVAAIEAFVSAKENQVVDTVDVPTEKHRQLIGRGGETRRQLEQQFSVSIEIPKQGSGRTGVKISGMSENVAKAKEHIAGLTKEQDGETVLIPKSLHHAVAQNGNLFRKLKMAHKVTVDHGGQRPPARPEAGAQRARTNGTAPPLITDEADADAFSWNLVETGSGSGEDGTIPWILSGPSPEQIASAKAVVEKAVESASKPLATGYLILPDPRSYRLVIGAGGRNINTVRDKTGCNIQVPKAGKSDGGEAIEIVGVKESCEEAKEMILEFVRQGQ